MDTFSPNSLNLNLLYILPFPIVHLRENVLLSNPTNPRPSVPSLVSVPYHFLFLVSLNDKLFSCVLLHSTLLFLSN